MSKTYVLNRCRPVHEGVWDNTKNYLELSVVYDQATGNSYTSKIPVPVGIALNNTTYWVKSSDFNAQLTGKISYYDTVSDMLSDPMLDEGYLVMTKGYAISGDDRSGIYEIVRGIYPNSDQYLQIGTTDLYAKLITYTNVDFFVSDIATSLRKYPRLAGETDDTGRFQRAIDDINANNKTMLIVPSGVFSVKNLKIKSRVQIVGAGQNLTYLNFVGNSGNMFDVIDSPQQQWFKIMNFTINSNNADKVINITNGYYFEISDIYFVGNGANIAINIDSENVPTSGHFGLIKENTLENFSKGLRFYQNANGNNVFFNNFYRNDIDIEVTSTNGIVINGNTFESFKTKAIWFNDTGNGRCQSCSVISNYIEATPTPSTLECGIHIGPLAKNITIIGNKYSNLRPSYVEVKDESGGMYTRIEYAGNSVAECLNVGWYLKLHRFNEDSKPSIVADQLGGFGVFQKTGSSDKIRAVLRDSAGGSKMTEIPYIMDSLMQMSNSAIDGVGDIFQYGAYNIMLGSGTRSAERCLRYNSTTKKVEYHDGVSYTPFGTIKSGTTAQRPTIGTTIGEAYFDTTLNKQINRNKDNNGWVDSNGNVV